MRSQLASSFQAFHTLQYSEVTKITLEVLNGLSDRCIMLKFSRSTTPKSLKTSDSDKLLLYIVSSVDVVFALDHLWLHADSSEIFEEGVHQRCSSKSLLVSYLS